MSLVDHDYIIDLTECTIPVEMIEDAVMRAQIRVETGRMTGQLVENDDDLVMDITKISHMVTHLSYKHKKLHVKISLLDLPNGRLVKNMMDCGMLWPCVVGGAKKSDITGQMIDWQIKSFGYMTTEVFPVRPYTDTEWQGDFFKEDLFNV